MPHAFTPREEEPQPETGGSRLGGPPHKSTAAGILDPPVPPRRPVKGLGPIPSLPRPVIRVLAILILLGFAAGVIAYFWK